MSIRVAKEISCDRCGTSQRLDEPTLTAEWPSLRKVGWQRTEGKHLCPSCAISRKNEREFRAARRFHDGND